MGLSEVRASQPELLVGDSKKRFVRKWYAVGESRPPVPWDYLDTPSSVLVVPLLADTLVMVRQYRPSLDRTTLELPAGGVQQGQSPEAAAQTELETETGYVARRLEKLGTYYVLPSETNRYLTIYLATDIEWTTEPQHDDEQEADLDLSVARVRIGDLYSSMFTATPVLPVEVRCGGQPAAPDEMLVDGLETIAALLLARPHLAALGYLST